MLPVADPVAEGRRILTICNACRYCEGFCAVFPALERLPNFSSADLNYLANLCHHCTECYYACQYAPPHEFAVDVPRTLASIRSLSYRRYSWFAWSALVASLAVFLWLATARAAPARPADFYAVIPHRILAAIFGAASLFALVALAAGFRSVAPRAANRSALKRALSDALALRYLRGCPSQRRLFHHLTFYGFLLCFAATTIAAMYHYVFGWIAPYGYTSLPVVLGTLGGLGLVIGPAGLLWLKQPHSETAFILLLLGTSATGLPLLAMRETGAMPVLLAIHLGVVLALFLTLPYGKFVHSIQRFAALLRYAQEHPSS